VRSRLEKQPGNFGFEFALLNVRKTTQRSIQLRGIADLLL